MADVLDQPTRLWKLERETRVIECLVRLVPYGIEVDIARDGAVILTRAFDTDADALAWADRKRAARITEGWIPAAEPAGPAPVSN